MRTDHTDKKIEKILEKCGWTIECYSPLEISHYDGSFASLFAAEILIDHLVENQEDYEEDNAEEKSQTYYSGF